MATLAAGGMRPLDASGLSMPSARWALVWAWLVTVGQSVSAGQMLAHPFAEAAGHLAVLAAIVLVTSRRNGPLPHGAVVAVLGLALSGGILGLTHTDSAQAPFLFLFLFSSVPIALLVVRDHATAGGVGLLAYAAAALAWGVVTSQDMDTVARAMSTGAMLGAFGFLTLMATRSVARRERAVLSASERRLARTAAADDARINAATQLSYVSTLVSPTLRDLAAGEPTDSHTLRLLTAIEGDVRDLLRAGGLRESTLASAVAAARSRGVRVVLIAEQEQEQDNSPGGGPVDSLPQAAVARLVDALDDPSLESLTIRRLPPGRSAALSLVATRDGSTTRVMLDAAGREV